MHYKGDNAKIIPLIKEKIHLLYTDPPYYFLAGGKKGFYQRNDKTIMDKLDESFGHTFDPGPFLLQLDKFIDDTEFIPNIYFWTNKQLIPQYLNWAIDHGFSFNILGWVKQNCPPLWKNNYLPDTEYCLFFRKKGAYFNSTYKNISTYRKWQFTTVNTNRGMFDHPTPKPEKVCVNHIRISAKPGHVVLDPFAGSGTTGLICEKLGINYILIEKEKKYCD